MTTRNRKPAPQLPPESLYVRAPRLIRDWIGRRVVFHSGAKTSIADYPPTLVWTVVGLSNRPRGTVRLVGVPCACCGITPRCTAHSSEMRLPSVTGWLPLPLRDRVVLMVPETTYGTDPTPEGDKSPRGELSPSDAGGLPR